MSSTHPSKYHIVKFILDIAYEDHLTTRNSDWTEWMNKIKKIFPKYKLPMCLVIGLYRKNNKDLNEILDNLDYIYYSNNQMENQLNDSQKKLTWQERYDKWIEKRDNGNKLAQQKRRELQVMNIAKNKEIEKAANESYIQQMKPLWDSTFQDLLNKRESDMKAIFEKI